MLEPELHRGKARERIILFLAFLTSPECQALCRKAAAPEDIAARLTRIWFDDLYAPGDTYLSGLKGHGTEADIDSFESSFSEDELTTMERFHGFFELRLNFLANSRTGRAKFPDNDSWKSLVRHADHVLSALAPNPDYVRQVVADLAGQAHDDVDRVAQLLGEKGPTHSLDP